MRRSAATGFAPKPSVHQGSRGSCHVSLEHIKARGKQKTKLLQIGPVDENACREGPERLSKRVLHFRLMHGSEEILKPWDSVEEFQRSNVK